MIDLSCRYLGLSLRSPIVASPSPLTGQLDSLIALQAAGVAAVVLPSVFEEEVEAEEEELRRWLDEGSESYAEASTYLPRLDMRFGGPMDHVRLLEKAKGELEIPIIASLNGTTDGGWLRYATMLADAGADALELNLYSVESDAGKSSSLIEAAYLRLVGQVRKQVDVPLAVKLSPYLSSTANFAQRLVDAGVDGLVLFNRFVQPDVDIDTLGVAPTLELSQTGDLRLPLRWVALLRPELPNTSLALTSGVHSGAEVVKALLAGADVAMMTSALLRHGPAHVSRVEAGLVAWMAAHDVTSIADFRGSVARHTAVDARAYERAQYIRAVTGYRATAWY